MGGGGLATAERRKGHGKTRSRGMDELADRSIEPTSEEMTGVIGCQVPLTETVTMQLGWSTVEQSSRASSGGSLYSIRTSAGRDVHRHRRGRRARLGRPVRHRDVLDRHVLVAARHGVGRLELVHGGHPGAVARRVGERVVGEHGAAHVDGARDDEHDQRQDERELHQPLAGGRAATAATDEAAQRAASRALTATT